MFENKEFEPLARIRHLKLILALISMTIEVFELLTSLY